MNQQQFIVVRTDAGPQADLSTEAAILAAVGARLERTQARDQAALAEALRNADAVIVGGAYITEPVAAAMERCQVVVRTGVGYDTLDVPALTRHGIIALNLPDIWTEEVANHALALLLALNRRLWPMDRVIREGGWRAGPAASIGPIYGETAGIVGLGRIGSAFARRCRALDMRVLAYDPYVTEPDPATGATLVQSPVELLEQSDYVSIHCLLNDETRHLIDESALQRMRPTAYLINTARGPIVDNEALLRALQEGWIAGAGLDTFEPEPPPADSPLRTLPNVILSPHNAFFSDASVARMRKRVADDIVHVLRGGWPQFALNPELATHPKHAHRSGRPESQTVGSAP